MPAETGVGDIENLGLQFQDTQWAMDVSVIYQRDETNFTSCFFFPCHYSELAFEESPSLSILGSLHRYGARSSIADSALLDGQRQPTLLMSVGSTHLTCSIVPNEPICVTVTCHPTDHPTDRPTDISFVSSRRHTAKAQNSHASLLPFFLSCKTLNVYALVSRIRIFLGWLPSFHRRCQLSRAAVMDFWIVFQTMIPNTRLWSKRHQLRKKQSTF